MLANLRLWQLISPALPIGAYAWSQGLETAVDRQWVKNEDDTFQWLHGIIQNALTRLDIPVLARLYDAWHEQDEQKLEYWNAYILACRESAELKAEDSHLGGALARLLTDLNLPHAQQWRKRQESSYLTLFALAAWHWHIPLTELCRGYLWSWCENQVAAAIKLVPLGQTQGQAILSRLIPLIAEQAQTGLQYDDEQIGCSLPGLVMASALHENQYSRLFRS